MADWGLHETARQGSRRSGSRLLRHLLRQLAQQLAGNHLCCLLHLLRNKTGQTQLQLDVNARLTGLASEVAG
jgi:hypothetical protein